MKILTESQNLELVKLLKEQISLCESKMDNLFDRFKASKIDREYYSAELKKWEDRFFEEKAKLAKAEQYNIYPLAVVTRYGAVRLATDSKSCDSTPRHKTNPNSPDSTCELKYCIEEGGVLLFTKEEVDKAEIECIKKRSNKVNLLCTHPKYPNRVLCITKELKHRYRVNLGLIDSVDVKKSEVTFINTYRCKTTTLYNAKAFDEVIIGNELRKYVGIGWVKIREINLSDLDKYPRVVDFREEF